MKAEPNFEALYFLLGDHFLEQISHLQSDQNVTDSGTNTTVLVR